MNKNQPALNNKNKLINNKLINKSFFLLIVFILIFIRFFYLDADPSFFKRIGDMADEGYWAHNARTAVLFENWATDDMTQSLFLSPLYAFLVYGSFKMGGVSLYSARIVSVFFSLLILLFLYLYIKAEFGKTAAGGAVVMLGFNQLFLIYNKMALVETTLTFFLLASLLCWHFQERSRWYSLGSGISFSLAVLTKVTAIYFLPVFALLIFFDKVKNRLDLKKLFIFASSTAILLSAYIYFIFLPNWMRYKKHLLNLMIFDHKSLLDILAGPFHLLSNNFFGNISIFILFILFLIYALNTFFQKPFGDAIRDLSYIEALALSWILGGITGLFFSSMHDRRFFILIIPLIILTISLLVRGGRFSIKDISAEIYRRIVNKPNASFLFSLYFLFPITSLAYFGIESYFHFHYSHQIVNFGSILVYFSSAILFNFWLASKASKARRGQEKERLLVLRIIISALPFTLLLPAITVGRTFLHNLLIALKAIAYEPVLVAIMAIIFLSLSFFSVFLLEKKEMKEVKEVREVEEVREVREVSSAFTSQLCLAYLLLNIIFIGTMFLFPSFTIRDASRDIGLYVPPGEVIMGSFANLLAIENKALPFLYAPYDPDYAFMNNDTKKRPAFLLISPKYDGKTNDPEEELAKYGYSSDNVTFIREFNLYRYPNNVYKNKIGLYRIEVS